MRIVRFSTSATNWPTRSLHVETNVLQIPARWQTIFLQRSLVKAVQLLRAANYHRSSNS